MIRIQMIIKIIKTTHLYQYFITTIFNQKSQLFNISIITYYIFM